MVVQMDLMVVVAQRFHKALFWFDKLSKILEACGFVDVKQVNAEGANTSNHWCSLNVEAWRRDDR